MRRGPPLRAGRGDASGMRGATAEGCAPPPPGAGRSSRSCRPGCQRLPGTAVTQACRHSGCAYRACTALTPVPGTPVPHGLVRGPPVASLVLLERAGASATLEPECEEAFGEEEAVFARSVGQEDARPSSRNPRSIRPGGASPGVFVSERRCPRRVRWAGMMRPAGLVRRREQGGAWVGVWGSPAARVRAAGLFFACRWGCTRVRRDFGGAGTARKGCCGAPELSVGAGRGPWGTPPGAGRRRSRAWRRPDQRRGPGR